jgi:small subunit ribosomal protein S4
VLVNGRRVDIPSYLVKPGDSITVKNRPPSRALARLNLQDNPKPPDFLELVSADPPEGRMVRLPERQDVDPGITEINEQLIIEISAR